MQTVNSQTMNERSNWIFKMLSLPTGRIITKEVFADDYLAAEYIARECVPAISHPVMVLSYQ